MKIIFMGTPEFAVPSLKILLENRYDVISVVTIPDRRMGRGQVLSYSEVKKFALEKDLSILQPEKLNDENFINTIKSLRPDIIIVVAFKILPKEIFTIPDCGTFNLHASLLPKYRGAAPINRALINGEKKTGVTTFFLKEKVDTGNIILQKSLSIEDDDDAGTLYDKLSALGAVTVLETVNLINEGNVHPTEQDNSLSSPAPKIFREDCGINWKQDAIAINNFVRGLSPYPAAFTHLENKIIKIYKTKLTTQPKEETQGNIILRDKKILVSANDYLIDIQKLQIEGKKIMNALDFINGLDKNKKYTFM
ncbi:MAG: methionyl-tRNA formyltransferase [bacterium]